jgi:multidrug transporter EmrE-like cation transporter
MNNFQIPLTIVVSCVAFGEKVDVPRFFGSAILLIAMVGTQFLANASASVRRK